MAVAQAMAVALAMAVAMAIALARALVGQWPWPRYVIVLCVFAPAPRKSAPITRGRLQLTCPATHFPSTPTTPAPSNPSTPPTKNFDPRHSTGSSANTFGLAFLFARHMGKVAASRIYT